MRLNRYLAQSGFGSRRAVESLILAGSVTVDGKVVTELGTQVGEDQKVNVGGRSARPPVKHVYGLLNKPPGYLCSASDPFGRPIIYDLLPAECKRLHYMGRLDFQSRGLLVLTTDGELTHSLLHPSREVPRTYRVKTRQPISAKELRILVGGVEIGPGEIAKAVSARFTTEWPDGATGRGQDGTAEIVLKEGKNREIRRMLEVLDHKVIDLQRIRFGGLELGALPEGAFRILESDEVALLHVKAAIKI